MISGGNIGVGVGVGVAVGNGVGVAVGVGVGVAVGIGVAVGVAVGIAVGGTGVIVGAGAGSGVRVNAVSGAAPSSYFSSSSSPRGARPVEHPARNSNIATTRKRRNERCTARQDNAPTKRRIPDQLFMPLGS